MDDLEHVVDDSPERPPRRRVKGRHRRSYRRRQARLAARRAREESGETGRGKTIAALMVAFLLLGLLGGGAWYGVNRVTGLFGAPDYTGEGTGEAMIQIKQGDSLTDVGNTLYRAGVVKSAAAFVKAANANSQSRTIQPGFYRLRKQMSAESALLALLDRSNRISNKVTIPEGRTVKQTFELLAKATKIPVEEFEKAAKDPVALGVPSWWFKREDGKPVAKTVEGFLFPATYEFDPNLTAAEILSEMVAQFNVVVERIDFVATVEKKLKISPFEALIVASLAQAEAGVPEDLGPIARVAYNRAYKKNMPLQFDVTANYWLELQGKKAKHSGQLTRAELEDPKNPYNTVTKTGLPVGPINSPGEAALKAAANPPDEPWLFFVAIDKSGKSAFATTDAEHERNIAQACKNGIPLC
ncbi:MAG TPA: endolytic transglycosylase MltG [Micromonospora sp.]